MAKPALALSLGGSLTWDFARTQMHSETSKVTQSSFGQTYRVDSSSALLNDRIGTWSAGLAWRDNRNHVSGINQPASHVKFLDMNVGLVLMPTTVPMSINFRRSLTDSGNGTTSQQSVDSTISFSGRFPVGPGDPLEVGLYQTRQDAGTGTNTARLVNLQKRFDVGDRSRLTTSYRFAQYQTQSSRSDGHGVSLSVNTDWSERLATNAYANVTSQMSTSNRQAGGQTLFINDSAGMGLFYRRGRDVTGTLSYAYAVTPQDQGSDIQNHQLFGTGSLRLDSKTDLDGHFNIRRLDLGSVQLDTMGFSVGYRYRPRFGWATGVQAGYSNNRTTGGATASDRNSYTLATFLNATHQLDVADVGWGGSVSYATTQGDFAQDRVTSTLYASAAEKQLTRVHLTSGYQVTDIEESTGGQALKLYSREHGLNLGATLEPVRQLFRPTDSLSATASAGMRWTEQGSGSRNARSNTLKGTAIYLPWPDLMTQAGYEYNDNSLDVTGADQVIDASATWTYRVFLRGTGRLKGEVRRTYTGSTFESEEKRIEADLDYSVGMLRASLTADATFVTLGRGGSGTDSNSVRFTLVRSF